ncbi:MAG: helix-turn-helix domain-containing protein [Phycisphaerae bacterium]
MAKGAQNDNPTRAGGIRAGRSEAVVVPVVTELIRFNSSALPAGWSDSRHMHPFHQIDVVLEGLLEHDLDGRAHLASRAGHAIVIPPLNWHRTHSRRGCWDAAMKLYLSAPASAALGHLPFRFGLPPAVRDVVIRASTMFDHGRDFHVDWAATASTILVLEAIAAVPPANLQARPGGDFRRRLLAVLSEVAGAPGAPFSVQDLADRCSVSSDHFTRLFERELGLTPRQFMRESRMRLAAMLLTGQPARSVKEVARLTGYTTVQAFSRAFREALDTSPASFQRNPDQAHGPSMNRRKMDRPL